MIFIFIQIDESQKQNVIRQFHKIKHGEEIWSLHGVYNLTIKTQIDLNNKRGIFHFALERIKGISEVFTCAVINLFLLLTQVTC